jgi:hypothetical protein
MNIIDFLNSLKWWQILLIFISLIYILTLIWLVLNKNKVRLKNNVIF